MEQSILYSWVDGSGVEFIFVAPYDPSEVDPGELTHNIPASDAPSDGEYQSDSFLSARILSMKGTIIGANLGEVQSRLNTLLGAHPRGAAGKFRARLVDPVDGVLSDYFLDCRVSLRMADKQEGFNKRDWRIAYRAGNPYWQEWTQRTTVLRNVSTSTAQAINFTPGGAECILPSFIFVVTTPGVITLSPASVFGIDSSSAISFTANVADTWTVDCAKRVLTRAGASGVSQNEKIVSGGFFALPTALQTLTVTPSGGAVYSSLTANWRRRFATI